MCGACGGGRAERLWEDAAGRVDAAGMQARARAVGRLVAGTRWRVRAWHGSWVVVAPAGRQRHAGTLDELFGVLPAIPLPVAPAAEPTRIAAVPVPDGWQVQAALVWLAAASAAGLNALLTLPNDFDSHLCASLTPRHEPELRPGSGARDVRIEAPAPDDLLRSLLRTASG